ncbi:hypothetical protein ACQKFG_05650 [Peribacillus sp. NPDC076916]
MKPMQFYEDYKAGYQEWKKDRAEKHEQTKALRKAKATQTKPLKQN